MPQKQTNEDNVYLVHKTDTCEIEDCDTNRPDVTDADIHIGCHIKDWEINII